MNWKLRALIVVSVLFSGFMLACTNVAADNIDNHGGISNFVNGVEYQTWSTYATLTGKQPTPNIQFSNERSNLIRRTNTWSSPQKRGYIYLINNDGSIEAFYSIQGKVSALDSSLTPPNGCREAQSYDYNCAVVDLPQADGSFGTNGAGIFFYTANGTYVEWNGRYMLTDRPVQLTEQPKMVITVAGDSGP